MQDHIENDRTSWQWAWFLPIPIAFAVMIPSLAFVGLALKAAFVMFMATVVGLTALQVAAYVVTARFVRVMGIDIPKRLWMHARHVWATHAGGGRVRAGIDAFAQRVIGEVDAVETRLVGERVEAGDVVAILRRGSRSIAARAPVAGTIARVNEALARDAGRVSRAPYGRGWLVELMPRASRDSVLASLMRGEPVKAWMEREVSRLVAVTTPSAVGAAMADGGEVSLDLSTLDDATWDRVQSEFFS
ncbi:MAG: glycine cleavage system protein H [Polyangiaceae bacterium]|nr:glycine cleavage system protein H [Polyangiaceae bacterium]